MSVSGFVKNDDFTEAATPGARGRKFFWSVRPPRPHRNSQLVSGFPFYTFAMFGLSDIFAHA